MLDYWINGDGPVLILCPAVIGREGQRAPNTAELGGLMGLLTGARKGRCVWLTSEDCCAVHLSGFKPSQCRTTYACTGDGEDNEEIMRAWDNPGAQELVKRWMVEVGLSESELEECF